MRLLLAIKSLALEGGGAERVTAELASGLAGRGHDVAILTFDPPDYRPFYPLDPTVGRLALGIGDVRRQTGAREAMSRILTMRRAARSWRPDIAIGFMHSSYIPLGLALLGTRIPLVASEHTPYQYYRDRALQAALLRLVPLFARRMSVLSSSVREGFPRPLRGLMEVVPNPVSLRPERLADTAGATRSPRTVLAVGRMDAAKDHSILIEAFARIAGDFPDWRLRIVGDGDLRPSLEAQMRRLRLEARVELPGFTAEIGSEYAAAQMFAMPSRYESFGLTVAEALAHGLPVVAFADCPGTNELVDDGVNGLLVDDADRVGGLARTLARLMADPALRARIGAAGPGSIERYSPGRVLDRWEALLARVAESATKGRK